MVKLLFIFLCISLGSSQDGEYRLFALNTQLRNSTSVAISAIENGTAIYKGSNIIANLDAGEIYTGSVSQHDVFTANKPIFGTTTNGGTISLAPESIQGTQFSIANNRRSPMSIDMFCISSNDCDITIKHPDGTDIQLTVDSESFLLQ